MNIVPAEIVVNVLIGCLYIGMRDYIYNQQLGNRASHRTDAISKQREGCARRLGRATAHRSLRYCSTCCHTQVRELRKFQTHRPSLQFNSERTVSSSPPIYWCEGVSCPEGVVSSRYHRVGS